jgi:hypothetical protein
VPAPCQDGRTKTARTPEQLIEVTIQPIIFLLLFLYVFGGAFAGGSRHDYLQYLLPGCSAGASPWAASRSGRT